jgi:hypothetical protein
MANPYRRPQVVHTESLRWEKMANPCHRPTRTKQKLSEQNTRRNAGISSLKMPYSLPDIWCGKG